MNEAAANALYEAERRGVKQITGAYAYADGSRCAMGVLEDASGINAVRLSTSGLGWVSQQRINCPLCADVTSNESGIIIHLNDDHGLTFSEIARKLGPDAA